MRDILGDLRIIGEWYAGKRLSASRAQIGEAMGWAAHTVHGFLASLAKEGIRVDVPARAPRQPEQTGREGQLLRLSPDDEVGVSLWPTNRRNSPMPRAPC
jgi:hypothetical protein